ncbi:uncharacterized protein LOC111807729 isoform X2 [Cucurbita pepo subsp. pepo]|uniref:uncharacterized protein LOC111807729 isoform X2 n=1 Tax=Cucurbita pepo subsp. pepo TaxID=3664 RepID=UPI000C9D339E|nr:uncharacterized protein LOC111807729 isoform X2 [Cucurbita pepo subsp. pepo]
MKRNLNPSISTDSNCRKRIKVGDLDCARPLTWRRDTSPVSLKEGHVTCPNNAKTSEFAFFKKFKEDANRRFSSSLQRQKELQSKKFNSTDHFRAERARHVDNRCKDFTSHPFVENVTPINFNSMHLPLGNSSKISDVGVKHTHKTFKDIQSEQRNVEKDDIFSRKRQKLRQFIQNMSFHGTGESYEKRSESPLFYLLSRHLSGSDSGVFCNLSRYGVISTLLSRLIPESNQYKNESDSPQLNNNLEKLQWLPGRCWPRLDYEHRLNNSSSPCRLNKSRGRVLFHSDFSTNNDDDNFHVKYRTKEFDSDVEGKMTLLDANSSPSTAAVENYRSLITLFNPQYGFYDQGEPLHIRKQEMEPLLLGWDTDDIKDDSSKFTEFHTFAEPPISFADDHQPNLQESFGAVALCSSPFPSSYHRNLYPLSYSSLGSYQIHGLSRPNVAKEEGIDASFNNVHLNFSSVPKYLSQYDNYVDDRGICDLFCAQSANWLMNYASDDEHRHPFVESMRASGFVFDFGWKYLSGSKEHCQTAYHLLEYPPDEMRPTSPVNEECNIDSSEYRQPFFIQPESFFQEGKRNKL